MMTRLIFFGALILTLTACQNGVPNLGPNVEERTAGQVASCRYIGDVRAIPKVFGPLKSVAQEDAERVAKRQVQQAGGNVVVFDPIDEAAEVFQVTGRAYTC